MELTDETTPAQINSQVKMRQQNAQVTAIDERIAILQQEVRAQYKILAEYKAESDKTELEYRKAKQEILNLQGEIKRREKEYQKISTPGGSNLLEKINQLKAESIKQKKVINEETEKKKIRIVGMMNARLNELRSDKTRSVRGEATRSYTIKKEVGKKKREVDSDYQREKVQIEREKNDMIARAKSSADNQKRLLQTEQKRRNQEIEMSSSRELAQLRRNPVQQNAMNQMMNKLRMEKEREKRTNATMYTQKIQQIEADLRGKMTDIERRTDSRLRDLETRHKVAQTDVATDLNLLQDNPANISLGRGVSSAGTASRQMSQAYSAEQQEERGQIEMDFNQKKRMIEDSYKRELQSLETSKNEQLARVEEMLNTRIKQLRQEDARMKVEAMMTGRTVINDEYLKKEEERVQENYNNSKTQQLVKKREVLNRINELRDEIVVLRNQKGQISMDGRNTIQKQYMSAMTNTEEQIDPNYGQTEVVIPDKHSPESQNDLAPGNYAN